MSIGLGVYHEFPSSLYHLGGTDEPSLSASIAKVLCGESPLHAWTRHPKLNPEYARDDDRKYDIGRVIHGVFLEGQSAVEVIDADNYRTKDAQTARDQAYADGKTPLLAHEWPAVISAVTAVRKRLLGHRADPPLFRDGKPEQTLVWEEPVTGVLCRSRLDWLRDDFSAVDDLKCTTRSANPKTWSRTIFSLGYDVQAEFYARGVERLTGVRPEFRLIVVEVAPPHAVSVLSLAPDAQTIARKKVDYAIELWARCLDKNEWPGFPDQVAYAQLPPWEEAAWLEHELQEAA